MSERIQFASRADFRDWLRENGASSGGVWLVLAKPGGPKTIKAAEALEEALCFGWIDGQLQGIDDQTYLKYFAPRGKKSNWSQKNKALAASLIERGLMARARLCQDRGGQAEWAMGCAAVCEDR